jgi:predicted ATP-grasp superfamily ATP-dependent carboligase
MNNKVVIIGTNHQNALGVIQSLARERVKPYVIIQSKLKKSFVLRSKYIERGWICSTDDDVLRCLLQNFTDTERKAVLYTCSDDAASLVDNNLNLLNDCFYLPNAVKQGAVSSWMNKDKMTKSAKSFGIATPKSWLINIGDNINEVEYPCITKSITSVKNGKADFKLCNNSDELKVFLEGNHNCRVFKFKNILTKILNFNF